MITKEDFIKIIEYIKEINEESDKWSDVGVDFIMTNLGNSICIFQDIVLQAMFIEKGVDWVYWWLYERTPIKEGDEPNKAYNEDGSEIPTETIDDLWNIVEKFRK